MVQVDPAILQGRCPLPLHVQLYSKCLLLPELKQTAIEAIVSKSRFRAHGSGKQNSVPCKGSVKIR